MFKFWGVAMNVNVECRVFFVGSVLVEGFRVWGLKCREYSVISVSSRMLA